MSQIMHQARAVLNAQEMGQATAIIRGVELWYQQEAIAAGGEKELQFITHCYLALSVAMGAEAATCWVRDLLVTADKQASLHEHLTNLNNLMDKELWV